MNKSELAEALIVKTGLSKAQASAVISSLFDGDTGGTSRASSPRFAPAAGTTDP